MSACTSIIGAAAGIIALTTKSSSPGMIGFSMSNALAFSSSILSAVRCFNSLEVQLNSFERVKEYMEMKQEPSSRPEAEPPAAWPTQGDLKVTELSVKYSEDGPEVLNKISFEIKPSERVGIVGRTGAGKSSLALSLLRFTEISNGSIVINGLDVQKINLEALRQRITIVPQDPILFAGTIRTNLDPFGGLDDTELQAALDGSGLAGDKMDGVDGGIASAATSGTTTPTEAEPSAAPLKRIGLDTQITSGGGNLSQGQRQLLAFARALIRRSKLVIFDEVSTHHTCEPSLPGRLPKVPRNLMQIINVQSRQRAQLICERKAFYSNGTLSWLTRFEKRRANSRNHTHKFPRFNFNNHRS